MVKGASAAPDTGPAIAVAGRAIATGWKEGVEGRPLPLLPRAGRGVAAPVPLSRPGLPAAGAGTAPAKPRSTCWRTRGELRAMGLLTLRLMPALAAVPEVAGRGLVASPSAARGLVVASAAVGSAACCAATSAGFSADRLMVLVRALPPVGEGAAEGRSAAPAAGAAGTLAVLTGTCCMRCPARGLPWLPSACRRLGVAMRCCCRRSAERGVGMAEGVEGRADAGW